MEQHVIANSALEEVFEELEATRKEIKKIAEENEKLA